MSGWTARRTRSARQTPRLAESWTLRWSTADAYLRPALDRKNLTVITEVLAHRVLFDGKRATEVEISTCGSRGEVQLLRAGDGCRSCRHPHSGDRQQGAQRPPVPAGVAGTVADKDRSDQRRTVGTRIRYGLVTGGVPGRHERMSSAARSAIA
jgi:hypothetical protein